MHAAAAGGIVAALSDLDGFTAKLNAILQADLTHAGGCPGLWRCVFRGRGGEGRGGGQGGAVQAELRAAQASVPGTCCCAATAARHGWS